MYHTFTPSNLDAAICIQCKSTQDKHACEICASAEVDLHWGMLLCWDCYDKEQKIQQTQFEKDAEERKIPKPDTTIQIVQDIFNSKIASIVELRNEIDADVNIDNKAFALAARLSERYQHLKSVITQASDTVKDAQNEQRAIQSYYNDLAKKLRADEREKIKIQDVQYKPPERPTKAPKAPTVKKYDKVAIKQAAEASGIPEALIQMTCVARQVTPIEAIRILREAGLQ